LANKHPTPSSSGVFKIDPDGAGSGAPFAVWCDMETESGGWTLCLNAKYTDAVAAKPLWTGQKNTVVPADPLGDYYDFCANDKSEYLFSLANQISGGFALDVATVRLSGASPSTEDYGVSSSNVKWLKHAQPVDAIASDCSASLTIWFWGYKKVGASTYYKRGLLHCDPVLNAACGARNWRMGAGCQDKGCLDPVPSGSDYGFEVDSSYRLVSSIGMEDCVSPDPDYGFTIPPVQRDRILVLYR
jgi:hypothetical protein